MTGMGRGRVHATASWSSTTIYYLIFFQALAFGVVVAQSQEDDGAEQGVPTLLESVQCLLEADRTISIQYSTFLESYVEVHPSIDYLLTSPQQREIDDDYSNENPVMEVKVCWCSQYFNRRYEYCPKQFDACRVDGFNGPITCFRDHQGGAFVRGFWFICVFWFLALVYAFSCTEQGNSARSFLKRKLCLTCFCTTSSAGDGNHHHPTEDSYLLHEIETMIEEDPDRATWLLRSAFLRERNRQRLQEARMARRRNGGRIGERGTSNDQQHQQEPQGTVNDDTTGTVPTTTNNGSSNNNPHDNSLSEWHQTMEIRVKKYEGPSKTADATESTCEGDQQLQVDNIDPCPSSSSLPPPSSAVAFSFAASASQMLSNAVSTVSMNSGLTWDKGAAAVNTKMEEGEGEEEETKCAICLSTVQVGDRIGDIPCGHVYCIECLKDWLKRKNHCPLCLRGGLATPSSTTRAATASMRTSAGRHGLANYPTLGTASNAAAPASVTASAVSSEELVIDPEEGSVEIAPTSPVPRSGSRSGLYVSMPDIFSARRAGRRAEE